MASSPPASDESASPRAGLLAAAAGWLVFAGGHVAGAERLRAAFVAAGALFAALVGGGVAVTMALSARVGRRGAALLALVPLAVQAALPYLGLHRALTAPGLVAAFLLVPVYANVLRSRGSSAPALTVAAYALSALAIVVQLGAEKTPRTGWHLGAVACVAVAALCFRAWHELGDPS